MTEGLNKLVKITKKYQETGIVYSTNKSMRMFKKSRKIAQHSNNQIVEVNRFYIAKLQAKG
jgi:hypothetical protein